MLVAKIGNFRIWEAEGGKSGKHNQTRGIQVREDIGNEGYLLLYTSSYKVGDIEGRWKAIEKCREYIEEQTATE